MPVIRRRSHIGRELYGIEREYEELGHQKMTQVLLIPADTGSLGTCCSVRIHYIAATQLIFNSLILHNYIVAG